MYTIDHMFRVTHSYCERRGYAGGFPNMHYTDYGYGTVYGVVAIKENAADYLPDVKASDLGNPHTIDQMFRAVHGYCNERDYVGGFPNMHQADYGDGLVYGVVAIKESAADYLPDVKASDLGNLDPVDQMFRAVHGYCNERDYVGGFPNMHYTDYGYGTVYGVVAIKESAADYLSKVQAINLFASNTNANQLKNIYERIGQPILLVSKYSFTFEHEIGPRSTRPHHPSKKSGVTIGPGYDMKERSAHEIINDLTAADVDPQTAKALSEAAGKVGPDADEWVNTHQHIEITRQQEEDLFKKILAPKYEDRCKKDVGSDKWDNLDNDQKAMLFDYCYNVGIEKFPKFTDAVIRNDWDKALEEYERKDVGHRNSDFREIFLEPRISEDVIIDSPPRQPNSGIDKTVIYLA